MIKEHLDFLEDLLGYKCVKHIQEDSVYLEVLSYKRVSSKELERIREILKTWRYISCMTSSNSSNKKQYIYCFEHYNLKQENRAKNLEELL